MRQRVRHCHLSRRQAGFSLGELLAVVIIGSMILVAILTIYSRASGAADAVLRKIDAPAWTSEVLQLMAEDLGRTLSADDTTIQIRNGFDNKFQRAELVLRRTYHDSENKEQTLEQITWRAGYDYEGHTPGLMIYRSYEGVAQEDKLLDDNRDEVEKFSPFIPICRGVTFFQIQACKGEQLVDQWPASPPPAGVRITISFAKPYETVRGGYDVDEQDKVSRTVAIDPMRKIAFAMAARADANGVPDPNAASSDKQSNKEPASKGQSPKEQPANQRRTNERTTTPTRSR
ncbi:MAG: prepilin-type N-terminal cleavage/methylation domain-containing protein [Planctomycetes bacterium]|nr:prepilin-type N-terminal cleavage/methylation domain-containing protein [Planctomycetota bacterium]